MSLLFLFYTNNNSVYLLFRLWLVYIFLFKVVLLHEVHVHDYVQIEKFKRPMISLCRSAFVVVIIIIIIIIIFIYLFIFFFIFLFTFKSLRDQYNPCNHDVERKVDSFQNKIIVNEDSQVIFQNKTQKTEQISYL